MPPKVSVVMAVWNGERYLGESIDSILNQTFHDFEFIIIDDGSFDATPNILARYEQHDPRIIIHRFKHNLGLSTALNFGIKKVRGEYIARMDADDISKPERFQEQVSYMDAHPDVGICGGWVKLIGDSKNTVWKFPTEHSSIHAQLFFANSLAHPTIMMRASTIKKHDLKYDSSIRYAQDYELWSRAISMVKIAQLEKILLNYRVHFTETGSRYRQEQIKTHENVYRRLLDSLHIKYSDDELNLHKKISLQQFEADKNTLWEVRSWLEKILQANHQFGIVNIHAMEYEIGLHWTRICNLAKCNPVYLFSQIQCSKLPFRNKKGFIKSLSLINFIGKKIIILVAGFIKNTLGMIIK